ncbi:hypothetical protein PCANC_04661 [Puccinia coronata f. sp. avenae]|uniref:Uncharacterized protein n=1 Tax=Puccinia coronata f. sp. avenae TaxID=200324 RepID=A0A2N5W1R9_9BASI|nr:hypothetical protein PCANC_04661 [Puccinia coronata f. sp. avenae]
MSGVQKSVVILVHTKSVRWMLSGQLLVNPEATSGRYPWTLSKSVLLEVDHGTVPKPPNSGQPMVAQECAHWSSAGTCGVVGGNDSL